MGKKKGKKGPPEKKSPFNLLTLEELEEQVPKMEAALPEKQAARNYAQVERDAVKRYFGVAQRDTDDVTTAAVATDKAIETLIEQHRVELEVYKQKVRHLSYQHTIEMENRAEKDRARHAADHDTHLDRMQRWEGQKTSLEGEIQDQEKTTGADAERLGKQNQLALTRMKEAFTAGLERFEDVCAARLDRQREELELRRRVGLHEAEEFNAAHVNALVAQHKTSLDEMKEYYRGVTAQNVSLITAYKAKLAELADRAVENAKKKDDVQRVNENLREPLVETLKQVSQLQSTLKNQEEDRQMLKNARERRVMLKRKLRDMDAQLGAQATSLKAVVADNAERYEVFERDIRDAQRVSDERGVVLAARLAQAQAALDKTHVQLESVAKAVKVDPATVAAERAYAQDVFAQQAEELKGAEFAARRAEVVLRNQVELFRTRLGDMGVPEAELDGLLGLAE